MNQHTTDPRPATRHRRGHDPMKEPMLIHEALARSRQREAEQAARRYRLTARLAAGRRWDRLAGFAARRAARARAAADTSIDPQLRADGGARG